MADFAVSAAIRAVDKFSGAMGKMGISMGKFGAAAEGAFGRAEKSAGLFRKLLGANILGNLITGTVRRVASGIKDLAMEGLNLASDLIEVQNVVDTSFGAAGARKVDAWAKTASNAFGLSILQAKQFSGTMGAMLKSSGLAGDQIVEMSTRLAGLAGDFASFYNLPIEEAFQKIRSGISGETEPLKQLGVNMNVANLQAYALTRGITKKFAAMKQGEQAQLRYMYLLQASADAQGDFAKTLETSYANQRRVLQMNVESVAARAMSVVLPLAMRFTKHLNEIVGRIGAWVENNKELIATKIESFVERAVKTLRDMRPVVEVVIKAVGWVLGNKDRIIGLWIAWTAVQIALNVAMHANPIGIVVLALEALVGLVILAVIHWKEITTWVDKAWTSIRTLAVGVWDTVIPYLKAFGGTLMKFWLLPLNLAIDAVAGLIGILAKLPGKAGEGFRGALDAITAFQDRANAFLTGSEKQLGFGDLWKGLGAQAPNEGAGRPQVNVTVPVNVDNSRAPGTVTTVRRAPALTGYGYANP